MDTGVKRQGREFAGLWEASEEGWRIKAFYRLLIGKEIKMEMVVRYSF